MFDKDAYKIPKVKKEFLIRLNDGTRALYKYASYLNEFSRFSGQRQSILELLND